MVIMFRIIVPLRSFPLALKTFARIDKKVPILGSLVL